MCRSPAGASKRIGRRVLVEIWGEGRLELIDELYAPDYVDHVSRGPEPSTVEGPDGLKQAVSAFREAFRTCATRSMARSPRVTSSSAASPPPARTGDINRVSDGRIVESWVQYDALGLLQQLGLVPEIDGV